jgi:hypothetical protein
VNFHTFHAPYTCDAESTEGGEEIFLVDWDAVFLSIVFWGLEEAETDVAVEHSDFEDGAESDSGGGCHICHCVEDHLGCFEETAVCKGAGWTCEIGCL